MKKLLIGLLALGSISSFAAGSDTNKVTHTYSQGNCNEILTKLKEEIKDYKLTSDSSVQRLLDSGVDVMAQGKALRNFIRDGYHFSRYSKAGDSVIESGEILSDSAISYQYIFLNKSDKIDASLNNLRDCL
jgi:hypothetical protein